MIVTYILLKFMLRFWYRILLAFFISVGRLEGYVNQRILVLITNLTFLSLSVFQTILKSKKTSLLNSTCPHFKTNLLLIILKPHESQRAPRHQIQACQQQTQKDTDPKTLLVPPRISPFRFEEEITEGMRTQLMCSSSQGDQPLNITWLKDGVYIPPESQIININEYTAFSSILTIHNVSSVHNGNYTCQITNRAGTVDFMAALSVSGEKLTRFSFDFF